jgi:hypothetical protein
MSRFHYFGLKITPITFYMDFEDYYKGITETEKSVGGMKCLKSCNDSASPSPLICTKELVE